MWRWQQGSSSYTGSTVNIGRNTFPCFWQDRVEEVQAALEELALEKERLLRRNADLQAELQARTRAYTLGWLCLQCLMDT